MPHLEQHAHRAGRVHFGSDMNMDIVIVREGDGYRLLHGHLRLANVLRGAGEARVPVKGEGELRILRIRNEYVVDRDGCHTPLRRQ